MSCGEVSTRLTAFRDGELPDEDARVVEAHLAECDRCRMELTEVDALGTLAREHLAVRLSPEVKVAFLRRTECAPAAADSWVPKAPVRGWSLGWLGPLRPFAPALGAAVAAALVVVVFQIFRPPATLEFDRPCTVTVLRYGESPGGTVEPTVGRLILGDPY